MQQIDAFLAADCHIFASSKGDFSTPTKCLAYTFYRENYISSKTSFASFNQNSRCIPDEAQVSEAGSPLNICYSIFSCVLDSHSSQYMNPADPDLEF